MSATKKLNIDFLQNSTITHTGSKSSFMATKEYLASNYVFFNNMLREFKDDKFTHECATESEYKMLELISTNSKFNTIALPELIKFVFYADKLEYVGFDELCALFIQSYKNSNSVKDQYTSVVLCYKLYGESFLKCPLIVKGWNWVAAINCDDIEAYENLQMLNNVPLINKQNDLNYGKGSIIVTAWTNYNYLLKIATIYCKNSISHDFINLFKFIHTIPENETTILKSYNIYKLLQHMNNNFPDDKNLPLLTKTLLKCIIIIPKK